VSATFFCLTPELIQLALGILQVPPIYNEIDMTDQSFTSHTAKAASSPGARRGAMVSLRPQNEKMDSLIRQVHASGEFTFEAAHARIIAAMKKATTHV
jgi:hypothetical protein